MLGADFFLLERRAVRPQRFAPSLRYSPHSAGYAASQASDAGGPQ